MVTPPSDFYGPGDYPFDSQSWRHQPENGSSHGHTNGLNGTHPEPTPPPKTMPIAIVGMGCRLPGNVSSPAEFWELCSRARTGFGPIPKDRFNHDAYYHPNAGKMGSYHAQGGNFLTHVDLKSMDAPFFGLTEKEAVSMDPQQRLLLECTFEALENGGIPKHSIVGQDVGVFVGGSLAEYEHQMARDIDSMPMHQATGCAQAMQSNRISHFFDLRGPSFTADTACSASLVALHLACQSMRAGESTHAIVGSCHLNMLPEFWSSFSSSRLLSDSGRSIAFDGRGTGFGRGEGCGVIVLKPLDEALRNNDIIRAVIHGSGINQDGKTPGITMPNGLEQERLINKVYRDAGISPADCGFVECHGTGTKVGDPIEATAIHNAIGQAAVIKAVMMLERGFLLPNHDFKEPNEKIPWKEWNLKVLKRQQPWPKAKKYISVNNFGFGGTNAHVVLGKAPSIQKPQPPKPSQEIPKQQNMSMLRLFTSAQSAKAKDSKLVSQSNTKLFIMTANDKTSLLSVMKRMVVYLEQRPEIFQKDLMDNFAYTLGQRRSLLQWRAAIATDTSFDLIESINSDKVVPCKQSAEKPRLGFIFTGQGAQWHAMGRELYHQYPIYAASIDRSDECLRELGSDWSLSQELLERDAKSTKVGEAHISQPSCTAVQLALIDLLRSWDVEPVAVVGHSSGEIGAAYAAGLLSFESAMAVAYHRGRLVPVLKRRHSGLNGAMMAVGGTPSEIQPLIDDLTNNADIEGKVSVACYNSPSSLTISGDSPALTALEDRLKSEHPDMFCRRLQVDTAYHCHHMNMIAEEYRESIVRKMQQSSQQSSQPHSNEPPQFFSSLHGHRVDGLECAHAEYWVRNLTNPVRFSEALDHMVKEADLDMLVELGPHSALQGPVKQILKATATSANGDNSASPNRDFAKLPYASALARGKNAVQTTLDLAGNLFTRGAFVNMEAINFPSHNHHSANGKLPSLLTDLPTYPFNHQHKFWHEPRLAHSHRYRGDSAHNDLIGLEAIYSNDLEPTWRNIVRLDDLPWLRHHEIQSVTIFPISGYAAMALEAVSKWCQKRNLREQVIEFELKDVDVLKPLVFSGGDSDVEMTVSLKPTDPRDPDAWLEFQICSWVQDAGWTRHCVGLAAAQLRAAEENGAKQAKLSGSSLKREISEELEFGDSPASFDCEQMYAQLSDLGVSYGPSFQGIKTVNSTLQCSAGDIAVIDVAHDMPSERVSCEIIQPNLLEAIIQMYWPVALSNGAGQGLDATVYLPSSIGRLRVSNDLVSLAKEPGTTFQTYCKAAFPLMSIGEQPRPSKASIVAAASSSQANGKKSTSEYLIQVDDLKVSPVAGGEAHEENSLTKAPRELCYKLEWEPVEAQDSSLMKFEQELVIIHATSKYQHVLSQTLSDALYRATSRRAITGPLGEVECEGKVVIVLDEIDHPFLANPTESQFQKLKSALLGAGDTKPPHGVLWVTNGAAQPDSGMITGLSRTVRSETLLPFASLDLESSEEKKAVESILSVVGLVFGSFADGPESRDSHELEFMCRNGTVLTPRIENDDSMNGYVQRKLDPSIPELQSFGKDARLLKLNYGGLSRHSTGNLHFIDDDSVDEPLSPDEIEFEVKAIGTNSSDIEVDANPAGHQLGIEASGIVTRVGNKSTNFTPGQRIACLALPVPGRHGSGMYRTRARSSSATVVPIPSTLSFKDAAAMPLAYCTAYYAVMTQARVQEGQSILIQYGDNSDAISVGHAIICLSQVLLGTTGQIYMAVQSEEQKKLVASEYGILEDHVFLSSRRGNISSLLHDSRGPEHCKEVDAVISVGRSAGASGDNAHVAQDLWSCVAPFGCMVDVYVGKTVDRAHSFSPASNNVSRSNTSYFSLDMFELGAQRPDLLRNLVSKVAGLIGADKLRSLPMVKTASLSEVEDIFKQLQSCQQSEKVVVTVEADCSILATQRTNPPKSMLRPDATYVLIGGAGGLGRSMARWMVSNGARNIVLVSRSASASGKVKELMNDLRATAGANILLRRCDVADKSSVDALFQSGISDLPPVRGIVHGSMVLKDVLFEKMSYSDYVSVIESKVQGAWNLHQATSGTKMDFFVAISSTAGVVGNRGQAAYAAANTFLDSFVQYRISQGLPAVSLDLTAVADAGYLAESGTGDSDGADRAAEVARNLGAESTMYEAEVLALLSAAIEGRTSSCNHQIVTGVRIPADRSRQPFWTTDAKFKHLRQEAEIQIKQKEEEEGSSAANGGAASVSFNAMLKTAQNTAEAEDVICKGLVHKIAALLMLEESDLDVTRTLSHYPLDSLVAIEIRNFLTREFEANLQVLELLSSGSIQFLSKAVCSKSKLCQALA
ncbi:beta-ketoacyl synthase domain-containing protein [Diaporthe amygdali]|uniref:beta-ketoacyl synthase domain-containing protein n=1 Tax=Phomopsis amygdali TaxID=1214568 RepID=UPI0022FF265F|nr:beta-ketoacyl synthase domain-containing protein [Diaporthe amygdali]KAJ0119969.1 beta-ketoacyl synthase domain-containing protein [Diaporthe amygdali]